MRDDVRIILGTAEPIRLAIELRVLLREFLDLEKLVFGDAGKMLPRVAGGPPNFDVAYGGIFAQSDVLLKRRGAKRPATSDGTVDGSRSLTLVLDSHLDPNTNGSAVGFHADKLQSDPVVTVSGIFENSECVTVSDTRAANFEDDVFIAAIRQVSEGDSMSFMPLARP